MISTTEGDLDAIIGNEDTEKSKYRKKCLRIFTRFINENSSTDG